MTILSATGIIGGILAIIFGIVIIAFPRIIAWLVGLYFIILGILAIIGAVM